MSKLAIHYIKIIQFDKTFIKRNIMQCKNSQYIIFKKDVHYTHLNLYLFVLGFQPAYLRYT